jgi:predicted RNase H-like HicB family nuclease
MQLFTCFVKKEGKQYSSLCLELDIASCGRTKKVAIEGLKNAIESYLEFMISEEREREIYRPVSMNELRDFLFTEDDGSEKSLKAIALESEGGEYQGRYRVVIVPRNKRNIPQGTLNSIWRQAGITSRIADDIWRNR